MIAIACLVALSLTPMPPQQPAGQQDPTGAGTTIRRPSPLPIPRALVLRRGDRDIRIDGSLQDWPGLPPIRLDDVRQLSGTALGAYRSRDDLAAKVFVLWDDQALYLAAVVLDDWHVKLTDETPRLHQIPPADALAITIDPRRDTEAFGADAGRVDDATVWLAEVDRQERKVVSFDSLRGTAAFVPGGEAVVRRDEEQKTTIYEARLPWADLFPEQVDVAAGAVFDVQFVLDDFDEPTDPLPQTRLGWTFGMGPRIDPGLLGSLLLSEADAESFTPDGFRLPAFPAPAPRQAPPPPAREDMAVLLADLRRTIPAPVTPERADPSLAGGAGRRDLLLQLDALLGDFPGLDYLRYQFCVQRRMNRECEGIAQTGQPAFWQLALEGMGPDLRSDPPERGFRVHRLPEGGWVVRSAQASFAIDPRGYRVDRALDDVVDFVLLTAPWDPGRRHDMLALRLLGGERGPRRVLQHVRTHYPALPADELEVARFGEEYELSGLTVRMLGNVDDDGMLSATAAWWVRWPDGTDLLVSSQVLDEAHLRPTDPIEALLLSTRHPRARIVGQRLAAAHTIIDDVLYCVPATGSGDLRARLEDAWKLQTGLLPHRSWLLAPGESLRIESAGR